MFTALYSMDKVYGVDVWLGFVLICAGLYLALCCLFRRNRTKKGFLKVMLGLLISDFICDAVWMAAFYSGGEYHDYGLGGSYMVLLIWPSLLMLAGICVTVWICKKEDIV